MKRLIALVAAATLALTMVGTASADNRGYEGGHNNAGHQSHNNNTPPGN